MDNNNYHNTNSHAEFVIGLSILGIMLLLFLLHVDNTKTIKQLNKQVLVLEIENSKLNNIQSKLDSSAIELEKLRRIHNMYQTANIWMPDIELDYFPTIPVLGGEITSNYGIRIHPIKRRIIHHNGIDIVSNDSLVYSSAIGVVRYAGNHFGYGNLVIIDHNNNLTTYYAHLDEIFVQDGDIVLFNTKLGTIGKTGLATSEHLHYEVRYNGYPVNPLYFLSSYFKS